MLELIGTEQSAFHQQLWLGRRLGFGRNRRGVQCATPAKQAAHREVNVVLRFSKTPSSFRKGL